MPTGTPQQRRDVAWGDVIYRSVLLSLAGGAFAFALNVSVQIATLDEKLISHISFHPNVLLERRMDREAARVDRLEDRVRELEIGDRADLP